MTDEQISTIKRTWRLIRQVDPILVGDLFYSKLFTDNPSLRNMFPAPMDEQYLKLINMMNILVARLDRLDELNDDIAAMARRHRGYGVRPAHYKMTGKALLWTLQQGLGKDWTDEVKEAWTSCYSILSATMISASAMEYGK